MAWNKFQTRRTFSLASIAATQRPIQVAIADVNGDGKPDLIITKEWYGTGTITQMLGNGNGTFQAEQNIGSKFDAAQPIIIDVDGDGKPDIVCSYYKGIACFRGNGNGTWKTGQYQATSNFPTGVAVGDLDGDGKKDLVLGYRANKIAIMLGNGNGTFQAPTTIAMPTSQTSSVALADFNGDGKLDIVATGFGSPGTVGAIILIGNGNGTFGAPQTLAGGGYGREILAADVDGDGKVDIISISTYGSNCACWLGNGNGTFQTAKTFGIGVNYLGAVAVADIDGDGKLDLVIAAYNATFGASAATFSIMLGNGDGTFLTRQTFALDSVPDALAVADINGDGMPDVVITVAPGTNYSAVKNVTVLLNIKVNRVPSGIMAGFP